MESELKRKKEIQGKYIVPSGPQTFFKRVKIGEDGKVVKKKVRTQVNLTGSVGKTSGLPRVVEIFEARTPKGNAVLAPISGIIKSIDSTPEGNRDILIVNEKEETNVLVYRRQTLLVNQGDNVVAGQAFTTGPKDPKEVLQINGVKTCQEYLVDEVQKTYRD